MASTSRTKTEEQPIAPAELTAENLAAFAARRVAEGNALAALRAHLRDDHGLCIAGCASVAPPQLAVEHKTETWETREFKVHPRTTRLGNYLTGAGWRCSCGLSGRAYDRPAARRDARAHREANA